MVLFCQATYCLGGKNFLNFFRIWQTVGFFVRSMRMSTKHGSLSPQELKRLQGGDLILNGYDTDEIATIVGVSESAVRKWRKKLEDHDDDITCLCRKQGSGTTSLLTDEQKEQLKRIILDGAVKAGYPVERWTSKIVADVIQKTFGIEMAPRTVRDLLPTLGLSPQMPIVMSHKHSDEEVLRWAKQDWKRIKKKRKNSAFP
jgi:transposase